MGSNYWRNVIVGFLLGTLIEYALCYGISVYFYDNDETFYALLIMLGLWALQIVLWAKNTIATVIFYYIYGKRVAIDEVENGFRLNELPIYDDNFDIDADAYFTDVIEDKSSTIRQLVFAAANLGQLQALKLGKPTQAWRMMSIYKAAFNNYRRHTPLGINRRDMGERYSFT